MEENDAVQAYNEMRAALPADQVRTVEAHASRVIAQYQAQGDGGVATLLYIVVKAAAMQEQGLL